MKINFHFEYRYTKKQSYSFITSNCETNTNALIEQAKTEVQLTWEFTLTKTMNSFWFDMPLPKQESERMLGLTSLEVYNSVDIKTKENIKFERYESIEKKSFILWKTWKVMLKNYIQKVLQMGY